MNVEAIKDAITSLSEDDRHSLAAWLNENEYQTRPMQEGFADHSQSEGVARGNAGSRVSTVCKICHGPMPSMTNTSG